MPPLDEGSDAFVRASTGAVRVSSTEHIQSLWSGFEEIRRLTLGGAGIRTAILKRIDESAGGAYPRGWDGEVSRRRKRRSHAVEARWYAYFAERCDDRCRVPALLGEHRAGHVRCLLLEDLDAFYPGRRERGDSPSDRARKSARRGSGSRGRR